MKKYRLKQWYPSLLKDVRVGDIITENGQHYKGVTYKGISYRVEIWQLHPDFWELIEEKYCDCNIPMFTLNSTFCMKCLKYIEEKKPLFVTEDGVEMFHSNQPLWEVLSDFEKVVTTVAWVKVDCKYFFHESNADEYIWRNKPVFSYEDFIKWGNAPYQRVIEQLAKERI